MNKVLVIAYYFPPLGLSGVQRTTKFVKYLQDFGWEPTVLTVGEIAYYAKDVSLLHDLEKRKIRIIRTSSFDANALMKKRDIVGIPSEKIRKTLSRISDTLFIPDSKIGWYKKAIKAGSEILEKEKFDLIFSTAPPYTDFLIGNALKKKFNIPHVMDYRDAWTDNLYKYFPTRLHKYINYRLEKNVLHKSNSIVTAGRRVKELLLQRYDFLNFHDINLISQGFDQEDFDAIENKNLPTTQKMRITYSGIFYEDISPENIIKAFSHVLKYYPKLRDKIELCFIGVLQNEYRKMIEKYNIKNHVLILGYLEHHECLRYVLASDVLWIMMNDDRTSPGKIFEYIGARKKILGIMPEGNMRNIILEANGVCVHQSDVQEIANTIVKLYSLFVRKELSGASNEVVKKYERKNLTFELSKVFAKHLEII
ncbi:MAG: glycosyltransferase family 4 protein [Bacteroidota bacterium]